MSPKRNKKILVTGGAGYIGSHTIVELVHAGYEVVSIDNFSNSTPAAFSAIEKITGKKIKNYSIDLLDAKKVSSIFKKEGKIDGIIHFAALKSVPDSVRLPLLYYQNNLGDLVNVLSSAAQYAVSAFVFSSSAAVYGEPRTLPVKESDPQPKPLSPYGATKAMGEQILSDVSSAKNLKSVALRYFNVAGAHPSGHLVQAPRTTAGNVEPILLRHAKGIEKKPFTVFGGDYPTKDGTCVRDYIHVVDLARAHVQALEYLFTKKALRYDVFNLGTGRGTSVLALVKAMQKASGTSFPYVIAPRRPGDPSAVFASTAKAKRVLGWKPMYTVKDMAETAWKATGGHKSS